MRHDWAKADYRRLREGNLSSVRRWIREYGDVLYTWIFYQESVDPSVVRQRTFYVFQGAFGQLGQFNPAETSMYGWLIARAESFYSKEAEDVSVSPRDEQPISDEDLLGLVQIGSQELPDLLVEHPAVVQFIQAALTDMDETERRVLLRRYHRIDRTAAIGTGGGTFTDVQGDRLAHARYFFRRALIARIRVIRPDLGEFGTDTRTAVFEKNLEKIFCSITPYLKLPDEFFESLEKDLIHQAEQMGHIKQPGPGGFSRNSLRWTAGFLLIVVFGIVLLFLFQGNSSEPAFSLEQKSVQVASEPAGTEEEVVVPEMTPEEMEAYLVRILEAGSKGDKGPLLRALEDGPYPAQIVAAVYLGRIGDESDIGPLAGAAEQWYPESLEENPFLAAIDQIEERLRQEKEQQEAEKEQQEEVSEAETEAAEPLEEGISPPAEPNVPEVSSLVVPESVEVIEPNSLDEADPNWVEPAEIQDSNEVEVEEYEEEMGTEDV